MRKKVGYTPHLGRFCSVFTIVSPVASGKQLKLAEIRHLVVCTVHWTRVAPCISGSGCPILLVEFNSQALQYSCMHDMGEEQRTACGHRLKTEIAFTQT